MVNGTYGDATQFGSLLQVLSNESAAVRSCVTICKAGLQVWLAKSSFESFEEEDHQNCLQ